jgi:hypothetical protein
MWKVFTGFPVLFLLARREWRAVAGMAAGCAALVLASLPFVGVATWVDWATYIRGHNDLPDVAMRNHGIAAGVMTLVRGTSLGPPLVDAPALVRPLTLALSALAVALTAMALLPPARRDDPRYALQLGATLVLAVLLTPKAWEHYGVYLLPCMIGLAATLAAALEASTGAPSHPSDRAAVAAAALLGAIAIVWGTFLVTTDDYRALGGGGLRSLALPAKMYASMALLGLCAWGAGLPARDPRPRETPPSPA